MAARKYFSPKSSTDHSDLSEITITRENPTGPRSNANHIQILRQTDGTSTEIPRDIQFAGRSQDERPVDWLRSVSFTAGNQLDRYHPRLPPYGNQFRYIDYPRPRPPEMIYYPSYTNEGVQRRNVWYLL
ncbi:hypothetical protein P879_06254 [Paragonimus westermani]|uniref:Uncharacterized protein n=1 Tax=Paragonimus westermani TaxID=34504 RepID=A0A8T0DTV4_9TREM|nr:hypothetical protein P879_06254 [Paragonimus westermani]